MHRLLQGPYVDSQAERKSRLEALGTINSCIGKSPSNDLPHIGGDGETEESIYSVGFA
jgi:hypothetical protein